jgi:hypothetical protein
VAQADAEVEQHDHAEMHRIDSEFHDHRQRFSRLRRASDQQALCDEQRDGAANRDRKVSDPDRNSAIDWCQVVPTSRAPQITMNKPASATNPSENVLITRRNGGDRVRTNALNT